MVRDRLAELQQAQPEYQQQQQQQHQQQRDSIPLSDFDYRNPYHHNYNGNSSRHPYAHRNDVNNGNNATFAPSHVADNRNAVTASSPQTPKAAKVSKGGRSAVPVESSMSDFMAGVESLNSQIDAANRNIAELARFHSYTLDNGDQKSQERQIKIIEEETSRLMNAMKNEIKELELENARLPRDHPDLLWRQTQHAHLRQKFLTLVQSYSEVERTHRAQIRQKIERQYRIVRPDASPDEIDAFVEREDGGQMFAQALMNSSRYTDASRTLDEVRSRHNDIQKIESTITQLAQMYQEVATLIQAQDEVIVSIESHVENTQAQVEMAEFQIDKAQNSARSVRKRKWCLLILLLIILAGVGVFVWHEISKNQKQK